MNSLLSLLSVLIIFSVAHAQMQTGGFDCSWSYNMLMNGQVSNFTVGITTFFVGWKSSMAGGVPNTDPVVARFDEGSRTWCRDSYETTSASVQATHVVGDGDDIFVAFNVQGQVGDGEYDLRQFTPDGWEFDYGIGESGVNVAVLLKIDDISSDPMAGTYITAAAPARAQSNWVMVDELDISEIQNRDGTSYNVVLVKTTSYYRPRRVDLTPMMCAAPPPYDWNVEFNTDLMIQDSYSSVCE